MPAADIVTHERLLKALIRIDRDLPTIPVILGEIMALTASDRSSAGDLVRILNRDQSLTTRILRVANSAFYGLRDKTATLDRALVILGFDMVRNLAACASLIALTPGRRPNHPFDLDTFWRHTAAVGVLAERLARETHAGQPGEAFTAGLIHDIGKLVLLVHFPDEFGRVLERAEAEGLTVREVELRELGLGHDFVAGLLLRRWCIPDALVEAVGAHHDPVALSPGGPLAALIHLANYASYVLEIGSGPWTPPPPPVRASFAALGLHPQDMPEVLKRLAGEQTRILGLAAALTAPGSRSGI